MSSLLMKLALVVLLTYPATGLEECSLHELAMNGAFPCGFEWWQKHDLGQDINVTNKISDIAKRVLMAVDSTLYNEIYEELFELPDIGSGDPIAKVIESTIILFPSVSGLLSEVMHAVDLSPEALTALNLSSEDFDKRGLSKMVKEYFTASCSKECGLKSPAKCFYTWVNENCYRNPTINYLFNELSHLQDAFCSGEQAKLSVLKIINKNIGQVAKALIKFFGVEEDLESYYKFRLSPNSEFAGFRNKFKLFLELATSSSCINDSPTTFNVLKERILNLVNVGGTPGSIEEIKSDIEKLMMCGLKFSGKFVPEIISSSTLKKFDVVVDRLGISKFKNKFADFLG